MLLAAPWPGSLPDGASSIMEEVAYRNRTATHPSAHIIIVREVAYRNSNGIQDSLTPRFKLAERLTLFAGSSHRGWN